MELWNEINLPIPPYSVYKVSRDKIDHPKLTKSIKSTLDFFRDTKNLHDEAAQLSRFIFLNCKQFRMFKGLHEMKKAHQALLRYLNLDFVTILENFSGIISDELEKKVSLPHRQNLDFILIRFQGLAKLLLRIIACCKNSARFFLGQIKAGSFYMKGIIFLGSLARVWNECRDFCKFVVEQFDELVCFRDQIKEKPGLGWVGDEYEPPRSLEVWLGEDYAQLVAKETFDRRLLLREEDIERCLEQMSGDLSTALKRIRVEDEEDSRINQPPAKIIRVEEDSSHQLDDFTPIPRKPVAKVKEKTILEHSLSSLDSKTAITSFIKNETFFRKKDRQKSLTIEKMNKKTWKEFKEDIGNKLVLMQDGALVNYVKDFLEECLIF